MEDPTLHTRIAQVLGWTPEEAKSFSMQTLREIVRPVDSKLADDLSIYIRSGEYITSPRRIRR